MKDIDKLLNEIKDEKDESQKKDKIKKLLTETDFILTKTALYPFEDEASKKESNYLKKFLEYKIDINPLFKGMDCDVNLYSMVMYGLLKDGVGFDLNKIEKQDSVKKYQIIENGERFRGDTLTSAQSIIKKYLSLYWLKINKNSKKAEKIIQLVENYESVKNSKKINKDEKEKEKDKILKEIEKEIKKVEVNLIDKSIDENVIKFYKLFLGVSNKGFLYEPLTASKEYYLENSDIIWNILAEPVKDFLRVYQMFGNYMCIPGQSYPTGKWKNNRPEYDSFNLLRSNGGELDTIDKLLSGIYGYYKFNDKKYIENLFTNSNKKDEVMKDTIYWLDSFVSDEGAWKKFVDINCLEAFLSKDLRPVSMKTGEIIKDEGILKYNPMPDSLEGFNTFFEQLSKRIVWRTIDIYKKLENK